MNRVKHNYFFLQYLGYILEKSLKFSGNLPLIIKKNQSHKITNPHCPIMIITHQIIETLVKPE